MSNTGKDLYEFGPFRLDTAQRLLLRDDQPIPLQPKAFETLLVLVRNGEKVVLKDDLLNAVWADTFVEESNLTQNIFVLRKALGDGDGGRRYIVTVPGRGYRFVEKVRTIPETGSHGLVRPLERPPDRRGKRTRSPRVAGSAESRLPLVSCVSGDGRRRIRRLLGVASLPCA
jgi:DNA-binding winged helix-turn-helix (wHTH) protein